MVVWMGGSGRPLAAQSRISAAMNPLQLIFKLLFNKYFCFVVVTRGRETRPP